jgi:preprotein translocase subunit Sss1
MSLDTGTGLAVLGVCGTIVTAIVKFVPSKGATNTNGYVRKETCQILHRSLDEKITELKDDVKEIRRLLEKGHG